MEEENFYNELANWDFSYINVETDFLTDWNFYDKIGQYSNIDSICLDLGTGGR